MAAGCAVVASSMPVLTRLLADAPAGRNSISIIDGGTPVDYAQAVVRMVERIESGADPGAKLGEWARQHVVWEAEVNKIAQLYLDLLGRSCAT